MSFCSNFVRVRWAVCPTITILYQIHWSVSSYRENNRTARPKTPSSPHEEGKGTPNHLSSFLLSHGYLGHISRSGLTAGLDSADQLTFLPSFLLPTLFHLPLLMSNTFRRANHHHQQVSMSTPNKQ